jgi:hypothetical protein
MRVDKLATIDNGVRVAPSRIPEAGNGLFAAATFSRNSYITLYDGETLTAKEAWSRPLLTHMAGREGVVVDGIKRPISGRGGGSFANASRLSRDANAEIVAWLGLLVLRAKRTILDGEEIFVHYGRRGFALAMPTPHA